MPRRSRAFALFGLAQLALLAGCGETPCRAGAACGDAGARSAASHPRDGSVRLAQADTACAMQSVRGKRRPTRKVDVIFVVDNSGSMSEEIASIRENINQNFATIITQSGVDFRVVMLSLYGTEATSICVEPPLAGASCAEGLTASTSEVFFHYNAEIGSNDAFCKILDTFDRA